MGKRGKSEKVSQSDTEKVPQSDTELREHLSWQLDFLASSIQRYEAGHEQEALRIATVLRILFHDKGMSHSLLGQLGFRDTWRWVDTGQPPDGHEPMPWRLLWIEFAGKRGESFRYAAPLDKHDNAPDVRVPFAAWWTGTVFQDNNGETFTREQLIRFVADQDGGAHVDPGVHPRYHALSRGGSAGLPSRTYLPGVYVHTPVWELIRQIAYEVQATVHAEMPDVAPVPAGRLGPTAKLIMSRARSSSTP
jgi:hypothetical protein